MNIFEFEDYRTFLKTYLSLEENQSSGARKRLLLSTGISSSLLTQILSEKKQLSSEQAFEIAIHMGFTDKETDYFLNLIDISRAGSIKLKERFLRKMRQMQEESRKIVAKVSQKFSLSEEQKAVYYSSWIYTAIRNLVPTDQAKSVKEIAIKLNIPESTAEGAVQFLIEAGLIEQIDDGYAYRSGYTHLDSSHPLIFRHHQNWRQRAIHRMDHFNENHLHYTCPMAISKAGAKRLRDHLLEEIKALNRSLKDTADVSYCLNIDFFEY